MKKKVLISIIIIVLILLGIYIYMQFKIPHIGEFYIRNTTDNKFSDEEKQEICNILNINHIEVYKTACEVDFRHEGSYYIFFYCSEKLTAYDIDDPFKLYVLGFENGIYNYTMERISMNTNLDSDYNKISNICKSNYKWWKDNEKNIDSNVLQNYSLIKLTPVYDSDGNIVN